MGIPVVVKASGGLPVTVATSGYGTPMEVATNGYGIAITQVASGGLPVVGVTFGPSIGLSNYTVYENAAVNTVVGTLSVVGVTGTPTYTLTDSAGAKFNISGSSLRTNAILDYETAASYNVTVSVSGVAPAVTATNFTIVVLDVTAAAPVAPVLLLTSDASDNTPDFTLSGDLALGDTVRLQYATASDFTGASAVTNTVDAGEDATNTLSLVTGALADGTWYFRARVERPDAVISDWSNTESVTLAVPTYVGPNDIVTGWAVWYGLRAFSAATIGNALIRVRRADAAEQDIVSASNGILNVADSFFNGSTPYEIVKFYDQAGTGKHLDALLSGTTYPRLNLNDKGTLPCIFSFRYNPPNSATLVHYTVANLSQPYSASCVVRLVATFGAPAITAYGDHPALMAFASTAGNVEIFGGTAQPAVSGAPIGVTHSIQGLFNNTASKICINGTSTTVSIADTRASGTVYTLFPIAGVYAKIWEGGWCAGDISSSFAALSANQHAVWNLLEVLPTTWDPVTDIGLLVLSGGNLVTTLTNSGPFHNVLGTNNAATGKYYFEVHVDTAISGQPMFIGIANSSLIGGGDPLGIGTNNGIGWDTAGNIWLNGSATGVGTPAAINDTICIAVDLGAKVFWGRKNAGDWNNVAGDNPATATGGVSFATMNAGPYFPCISLGNIPSGTVAGTANFGSTAYAQTKPSGFSNW